jgi:hypothetical protein
LRQYRTRAVDGVLVVAGGQGAPLLEQVEGAFDDVATLVGLAVELRRERAPAPVDSRNIVTLTPRGMRRLDELGAALGDAQDALLASLPGKDRDVLVALLRELVTGHAARR